MTRKPSFKTGLQVSFTGLSLEINHIDCDISFNQKQFFTPQIRDHFILNLKLDSHPPPPPFPDKNKKADNKKRNCLPSSSCSSSPSAASCWSLFRGQWHPKQNIKLLPTMKQLRKQKYTKFHIHIQMAPSALGLIHLFHVDWWLKLM